MHFHPLSIFALMLLGHLVADYTLQGWLANGKSKLWWESRFDYDVPVKYRRDYVCVLFCHALYWSLIVCLPIIVGVIDVLVQLMMSRYSGNLEIWVAPATYVEEGLIGAATYAVVALLHMRRIRKVPLALAMKVQE